MTSAPITSWLSLELRLGEAVVQNGRALLEAANSNVREGSTLGAVTGEALRARRICFAAGFAECPQMKGSCQVRDFEPALSRCLKERRGPSLI